MSGEFLGQFCASYRYKYACQGHLKLYAFKYKYTFQGYMHLYAHNCIWRHGSTALRDWLKKKRNIVFFLDLFRRSRGNSSLLFGVH